MKDLSVEDKLAMAHFYNLSCLSDTERKRKLKDLVSKGFSLGKLSVMFKIPKTTIHGWVNPDKKKVYYKSECSEPSEVQNKEVQNKTRIDYSQVQESGFDIASWISIGMKNIKEVKLSDANKKLVEMLILKLSRVRGIK